jgi:hypothetical protein
VQFQEYTIEKKKKKNKKIFTPSMYGINRVCTSKDQRCISKAKNAVQKSHVTTVRLASRSRMTRIIRKERQVHAIACHG